MVDLLISGETYNIFLLAFLDSKYNVLFVCLFLCIQILCISFPSGNKCLLVFAVRCKLSLARPCISMQVTSSANLFQIKAGTKWEGVLLKVGNFFFSSIAYSKYPLPCSHHNSKRLIAVHWKTWSYWFASGKGFELVFFYYNHDIA